MPVTRRVFLASFAAATAIPAAMARAGGGIALDGEGKAIRGYDARGYFTAATARVGVAAHSVVWQGAEWRFASAEDAAAFAAAPNTFAPQFGGYCTRAMSFKRLVPADPEVWRIYGDKLYMFARPVGGEKFDEGQDAMIAKAKAYWDTL
ncbi:MAG: YHS domain-containing (seleno)protein [Pseudomonadota bacterium]